MHNTTIKNIIQQLDVFPVLGTYYQPTDFVALDLSARNTNLTAVDVSKSNTLSVYINNYIKQHHVKVAFGGYLEQRNIYNRSRYFSSASAENKRNIHLGMDLWVAAQTPIYAPLNAEVHSFKNNTNFGDYGPTIILKHTEYGVSFYTLYGHLSLASITNISVGQKLTKGDAFAALGNAEVNGDYPPHLHFQIIKNIGDNFGDYPGVCTKKDLNRFIQNCPNPNILLRL